MSKGKLVCPWADNRMHAVPFFYAIDLVGTFAFGLSGAMVAVRRQLDLFGILVLAAATGVAGGMIRDLLLGDLPPEALHDTWPLVVACLAGVCGFFFGPLIERLNRPVMLLDAVGLGVFAVAGCQKALASGLNAPGAVLLGMMTAVGGGVLRDVMAAEIPRVLREDVYALAALAGAAIYVIGLRLGASEPVMTVCAVPLSFAIRVASVRYGWKLPRAPWS